MNLAKELAHTYSSKPVLKTARDGIMVAIATVLILVLFTYIYHWLTGTDVAMTWWDIFKSILLAFVLAFVYEYGGINSRLSAEAMQYAKGSVLAKYQNRNLAEIAEISGALYRDAASRGCNREEIAALGKNVDRISAMARATRELKLLNRHFDMPADQLHRLLQTRYGSKLTLADIENLRNLHPGDPDGNRARLLLAPRLVEMFGANPELVKYFIKNGFAAVRGDSVDIRALESAAGVKIIIPGIGTLNTGTYTQVSDLKNESDDK